MTSLDLTQPAPITANQALANFDSGEFSLNEWLKKRAFKNHAVGASRCFVVCAGVDVIGYYSLSAGAISHEAAPKAMRRNMPDPLPVLLLGRLADHAEELLHDLSNLGPWLRPLHRYDPRHLPLKAV